MLKSLDRVQMLIPVEKLAHDVPVDHRHVETLRKSICTYGHLDPILVWTEGNKIIDGFHRYEALRLEGAKDVLCDLVNLSEEEFFDARITSAVTHEAVTFARIVVWAKESFSLTRWKNKIKPSVAFRVNKDIESLSRTFSSSELEELQLWVSHKAEIWGLPEFQIARFLEIEEIIRPEFITMVRDRGSSLTPAKLEVICKNISDPRAQKAFAERVKIHDIDFKTLRTMVVDYKHMPSSEKQKFLETPLKERFVREPSIKTPEQIAQEAAINKLTKERSDLNNLMYRLDALIKSLKGCESLKDKHIDLWKEINDLIKTLYMELPSYIDNPDKIISDLQNQIKKLKEQNIALSTENDSLKASLTRLKRLHGYRQNIEDFEIQSRKTS